jgi:hypothetical protein
MQCVHFLTECHLMCVLIVSITYYIDFGTITIERNTGNWFLIAQYKELQVNSTCRRLHKTISFLDYGTASVDDRRACAHLDVGVRVGCSIVANQHRVTLAEVARSFCTWLHLHA